MESVCKKISKFLTGTILIVFVLLLLCAIGFKLFPQYVYTMLWMVLGIALIGSTCVYTIMSVLYAVKNNESIIYKNNLMYVLLSEEDVIWCIMIILSIIILVIFSFNIWLYTICLILLGIMPRKVSKHFKNKLVR